MKKILSSWFNRYLSQQEAVILLMFFIAAVIFFKILGSVLAPIIVGVILAYLLHSLVKKLEKLRFPHLLAVTMVFLLFISLLLLLFLYLLPLLWEELIGLISEIPTVVIRGQEFLFSLHDRFPELVSINQLRQIIIYVRTYLANFGNEVIAFSVTSLLGIVTMVIYLILVPLLVFFFLRDGKIITRWLLSFLPEKRDVLKNVWHEVYEKISSYIRGKIVEIVVISLLTIITFWLLGLRYAVLLGALVGLSTMIPYIGFAIITIPIVVVGMFQWGWSGHFFYLMLAYTIISVFDANILVPVLFAEVMNLHPLAIILAVLFFGSLFGFWGVFFSIPLISLVNVVIKAWPKKELKRKK